MLAGCVLVPVFHMALGCPIGEFIVCYLLFGTTVGIGEWWLQGGFSPKIGQKK